MKKNPFGTYPHKFYIKDKTPKKHWVGHSQIKPIDVDEFFNRRFIIGELEYSFNDDDTIGASVVPKRKIETSVVAEVVKELDITVGEVGE